MKKIVMYGAALLGSLVILSLIAGGIDSQRRDAQSQEGPLLSAVSESGLLYAQTVMEMIESGRQNFIVIDARRKSEYDRGHIPGAVNIFPLDVANPESLAKLPKNKGVIIYCSTEQEQTKIIATLSTLGYKTYGIKYGYDGYAAWKSTASIDAAFSITEVPMPDSRRIKI